MSETPTAVAVPAAAPATVQEQQAAIEAEYSTYVALQPIDIAGGRAFNTGDAVPVSHVERGVVSPDIVAKITTKAGRQAAGIEEKG